MNNLQNILHEFVKEHPAPGGKPEIALTVGTHDPNRDNAKFRLSDAGKCRLMRYYKRQGKKADDTIPAPDLLQMQIGNMFHAYIEYACDMMGVVIASEERLEDEDRIGHFDMIIRTDGEPAILYDIKTINSKAAYYMNRNNKQTKPEHIAQVISYVMALDDAYHMANSYLKPPERAAIAYVVRDTFKIREVELMVSEHEDAVRSDWNILLNAWDYQEPPEANPTSWECRYCAYKMSCPSSTV